MKRSCSKIVFSCFFFFFFEGKYSIRQVGINKYGKRIKEKKSAKMFIRENYTWGKRIKEFLECPLKPLKSGSDKLNPLLKNRNNEYTRIWALKTKVSLFEKKKSVLGIATFCKLNWGSQSMTPSSTYD